MKKKFIHGKRTHDKFYLNEKFVVKESFKFLLNEIKKNHKKNFSIIDIGCATGVFVTYLKQELPNVKISAGDINKNLLIKAKKNCPSASFYKFDINNKKSVKGVLKNKKFDVVILDGVHTIFDSVDTWVQNLSNIVTKNGYIYVFGSFNERNFDLITRVKEVGKKIGKQDGIDLV